MPRGATNCPRSFQDTKNPPVTKTPADWFRWPGGFAVLGAALMRGTPLHDVESQAAAPEESAVAADGAGRPEVIIPGLQWRARSERSAGEIGVVVQHDRIVRSHIGEDD